MTYIKCDDATFPCNYRYFYCCSPGAYFRK